MASSSGSSTRTAGTCSERLATLWNSGLRSSSGEKTASEKPSTADKDTLGISVGHLDAQRLLGSQGRILWVRIAHRFCAPRSLAKCVFPSLARLIPPFLPFG
jgi:hypothetical protein